MFVVRILENSNATMESNEESQLLIESTSNFKMANISITTNINRNKEKFL